MNMNRNIPYIYNVKDIDWPGLKAVGISKEQLEADSSLDLLLQGKESEIIPLKLCTPVISDQVGVVGDAPGNGEEVLEESQTAVVAAHPGDGVSEFSCAIHSAFVLSDIDFAFSPNRGCCLAGKWGVGLPSVHVRPGRGRKARGLTRRLWGFQQIVQGDSVQIVVDQRVQLLPYGAGRAGLAPGAFRIALVGAGHRRQAAFGQAQDFA